MFVDLNINKMWKLSCCCWCCYWCWWWWWRWWWWWSRNM